MADHTECNKSLEVNDDEEKIGEWSDAMCIKIAMEDNFPAIVKNLTVQKSIINRFLNFYLSGKVQKGLNARDIIFAALAIMPYSLSSDEFIWSDKQYSEDGNLFFLSPEDRLQTEIRHVMSKHNQNSLRNESEQQDNNNEQNDVKETSVGDLTTDELPSETNIDTDASKSDQENDATEKTESTPNDNDDTTETTGTDNEQPPSKDLIWYRKKPFDRTPNQTNIAEYGPVENAAFCISCNKLLDNWDADVAARIKLKYFFGVVALSLMRTMVKSHQHVMKMFTSTFHRTIACIGNSIHYSPPSNACVKKSFKTLRIEERKTKIMFAKLVINSFYLNHKYNNSREDGLNTGGIKNIFNVTVMAPTADYGMDVITMLQDVASRTHSFRKLFEQLHADETAASWIKVNDFFNKYMSRSGFGPTCHWARIIDKEQFKYLSCENCYELAVVIAVFVEKLSGNDGVWNARWVKNGKNLEAYKQLGLKMYKDYEKVEDSDWLTIEEIILNLNIN